MASQMSNNNMKTGIQIVLLKQKGGLIIPLSFCFFVKHTYFSLFLCTFAVWKIATIRWRRRRHGCFAMPCWASWGRYHRAAWWHTALSLRWLVGRATRGWWDARFATRRRRSCCLAIVSSMWRVAQLPAGSGNARYWRKRAWRSSPMVMSIWAATCGNRLCKYRKTLKAIEPLMEFCKDFCKTDARSRLFFVSLALLSTKDEKSA